MTIVWVEDEIPAMLAFFGVFGATALCLGVGAVWEIRDENRSLPISMVNAAILVAIGILMLLSAVLATVIGV